MKSKNVAIIVTMLSAIVVAAAVFVIWYYTNLSEINSRVAKGGKPNIIILLADDVGYADFQTYGHPTQEWTAVDRMAEEGIRFTNFYSPAAACSPSRAAILTGRYPIRTGVYGKGIVFGPHSSGGLPKHEITIAEVLKDGGYVTGMNGKWHLGINRDDPTDGEFLPHNQGFDYVGTILPLSQMWACDPKKYKVEQMRGCFLYRNDTIIEQPINLNTLTSRLVNETKEFINKNKDRPFFYLLSFPQTHSAIFANPTFYGKSKRGLYGDAINEMSWGVGEVLDYLIELSIDRDTMVIFLSDQGPIKDGCSNGGSTGFFRGGKATTWEGGVRVPVVAWWPGTIPEGKISDDTLSHMDLFPTIQKFAGLVYSNITDKNYVDGKDQSRIFKGNHNQSPHKALFYYYGDVLTAVRYERYKIHYHTLTMMEDVMEKLGDKRCNFSDFVTAQAVFLYENRGTRHDPPLIYDLDADPEEQVPLDSSVHRNKVLLETVDDLVQSHKLSILPVQSEVDKPQLQKLFPCCNPPSCTCNYNEAILGV